jgi:hypothetical protein
MRSDASRCCSTPAAEDAYAAAAAAVCNRDDPADALRRALELDPDHAAAAADLRALSDKPAGAGGGRTPWERRHVEIVRCAGVDALRAEVLLREHTALSGCDPVALAVVARNLGGLEGQRLADMRGTSCTCAI